MNVGDIARVDVGPDYITQDGEMIQTGVVSWVDSTKDAPEPREFAVRLFVPIFIITETGALSAPIIDFHV